MHLLIRSLAAALAAAAIVSIGAAPANATGCPERSPLGADGKLVAHHMTCKLARKVTLSFYRRSQAEGATIKIRGFWVIGTNQRDGDPVVRGSRDLQRFRYIGGLY